MKGILGDAFIIGFVVLVLLTATVPLWYNVLVARIEAFKKQVSDFKEERDRVSDEKLWRRAEQLVRNEIGHYWSTEKERKLAIERVYRKLKNG